MRCLGRLVLLVVILIVGTLGWLYRDELMRWGRGAVDPISIQRRVGHPSQTALASAIAKVDHLQAQRPDSILLNADDIIAKANEVLQY